MEKRTVNYNLLRIKITDEFDKPIIDIKGNSRKIKDALNLIDLKYNGRA
jgi:hypothetical protein